MTVKELKELLKNVPDDAVVLRESGEYNGATTSTRDVKYHPTSGWNKEANTVVIS